MAYGSVAGTASLAKTWTRGGVFFNASVSPLVSATKPTLAEVTDWLDLVSATFDTALNNYGFTTPVVAANSLKTIGLKVNGIVSDLAGYVNSYGRLFTASTLSSRSPWSMIEKEIDDWVKNNVAALIADGVPYTDSVEPGGATFSVPAGRQP
jgi:hypothetical protein